MRHFLSSSIAPNRRENSSATETNELQVVELLQQKVARIIVQADRRMILGVLQEHLEGRPIKDI
jgi:hypothetical protein